MPPPVRRRLRDARQLRMPSKKQQRQFEAVDLEALEREVLEVQAVCDAAGSPLVCSHNDLLSGNIMVPLDVSPAIMAHLVDYRLQSCRLANCVNVCMLSSCRPDHHLQQ